jgi:hypothetical protein
MKGLRNFLPIHTKLFNESSDARVVIIKSLLAKVQVLRVLKSVKLRSRQLLLIVQDLRRRNRNSS